MHIFAKLDVGVLLFYTRRKVRWINILLIRKLNVFIVVLILAIGVNLSILITELKLLIILMQETTLEEI